MGLGFRVQVSSSLFLRLDDNSNSFNFYGFFVVIQEGLIGFLRLQHGGLQNFLWDSRGGRKWEFPKIGDPNIVP